MASVQPSRLHALLAWLLHVRTAFRDASLVRGKPHPNVRREGIAGPCNRTQLHARHPPTMPDVMLYKFIQGLQQGHSEPKRAPRTQPPRNAFQPSRGRSAGIAIPFSQQEASDPRKINKYIISLEIAGKTLTKNTLTLESSGKTLHAH
jgi:hypothetical protein